MALALNRVDFIKSFDENLVFRAFQKFRKADIEFLYKYRATDQNELGYLQNYIKKEIEKEVNEKKEAEKEKKKSQMRQSKLEILPHPNWKRIKRECLRRFVNVFFFTIVSRILHLNRVLGPFHIFHIFY